MQEILAQYFAPFSKQQVAEAADAAYAEYEAYHSAVQQKAQEYLAAAKQEHQPVVVLCGRPYHVDPEVSHGIDKLLCDLGAAVITEASLSPFAGKFRAGVRNQWTYHARMYAAAKPCHWQVAHLESFHSRYSSYVPSRSMILPSGWNSIIRLHVVCSSSWS